MNGINFFFLGQRDDAFAIEVRLYRALAGTDQISFIRFKAVERQPVFLRIDRHGAQAKLIGRSKNSDGDLAPIGRQQFTDGPANFHSTRTDRRSMREILHGFMDAVRGNATEV
jgi:hypothetical protein